MNNHSYIVYAWRDKDQEPYFVSKCRSDSDAPYKDKKNILAPSDPSRIVVLKEFEDEMDSLDYFDRLTYELGFEADGSGTLQNSMISPYHLRTGKKCAQPVTVYRREDESFIGDFESVASAFKALRINMTAGYSCLADVHYAGQGKYRFLQPYRPIPKHPRKRRPLGAVHPNTKKCWAYTKAGEFSSYGEVADPIGKPERSTYSSTSP